MSKLARVLSRPVAKPYRSKELEYSSDIHLDAQGLLQFSPDDVENPKNWSKGRKWYITLTTILLSINGNLASSSPSGCLPSLSHDLGVSTEVAQLTLTLFVLGFCAGPCLWAPLSESYGRRNLFILTFVCYFAFTFLCAFAPNIAGLLLGRFLCGTFISGAMANTTGVFADLWGPIERGNAMLVYTVALCIGPALGPITSGFYQLELNWRWNFYQLLWMGAFSLLLLPTLSETLPSRALLNKARSIRRTKIPGYEAVRAPVEVGAHSLGTVFQIAVLRPWRILLDPIAGLVALYITVVYTLIYMLFTIFPIAFIEIRGFNAGAGELPLLSIAIGAVLGFPYAFWDSSRLRRKIAAGHQHRPEDSLPIAMLAAITFPLSMFLLAWTGAYASIHWVVPCIGGVVLGFSILLVFVAFLGYLSESYLIYAASAQAGNQIVRSASAAVAPLYARAMFDQLGVGGGGSLIAGVGVLLMPIPFVFYRYGGAIRARSAFAPTLEAGGGGGVVKMEGRRDAESSAREDVREDV